MVIIIKWHLFETEFEELIKIMAKYVQGEIVGSINNMK